MGKHPRLPFEQLQFAGYEPGKINMPTTLPAPIELGAKGWQRHKVMQLTGCYLIHLEPDYLGRQHYLGMTEIGYGWRLNKHYTGHGARLLWAAGNAGCKMFFVAYWAGFNYHDEIGLKRPRNHAIYCPVCAARRQRVELDEVQFMGSTQPYSWLLPTPVAFPAVGMS